MLRIRGSAAGTALTGTLYEPGENPPSFRGAPDDEAPYVWVCDAFYQVESGGQTQQLNGEEIQVAFESPMPRGFDDREQAIESAQRHIRTQFARIGIDEAAVDIETLDTVDEPTL